MKNLLRNAVEQKKEFLINNLIQLGFYKKEDRQLFELTLSELEEEYRSVRKSRQDLLS